MQHLTSNGKQLCGICGFPVRGKPQINANVYHMACMETNVKEAHKQLKKPVLTLQKGRQEPTRRHTMYENVTYDPTQPDLMRKVEKAWSRSTTGRGFI